MMQLNYLAETFSWFIVVCGVLLSVAFLAETAAGLFRSRQKRRQWQTHDPKDTFSGVVVIPAHDEAAIIGDTVEALKAELPDHFRILVIADNCVDDTAKVAEAAGVEVIERQQPDQRGKGYALAFARDFLLRNPPSCIIVLDADCSFDPGSLQHLADCVRSTGAAAQARNLLRPNLKASPLTQISTFAFMVKNYIRQIGLQRLRAPAVLAGTGMAFPWSLFNRPSLGDGCLAEDLQLSTDLVRAGELPVYCDAAHVWSDPAPAGGALDQRTRWEAGFLSTAASHALPLLVRGLQSGNWAKVWMGLHLLVPPLALLILLHLGFIAILVILNSLGASSAPLWIEACLFLGLSLLVVAMWLVHGRAFVSGEVLLRIPLYILWKIPIYLRLLSRGNVPWLRTQRR